jgi:transcription elongation GreA/GreB family factor
MAFMVNLQDLIDEKLKFLETQIAQAKRERDNAATPMESHSDQTRAIADAMVQGLLDEYEKNVRIKRDIDRLSGGEGVGVNKIVKVVDGSGRETNFVIAPSGLGGVWVGEYLVLSVDSPLAIGMLGKNAGHKFVQNTVSYEVISVENN